MKLMISFDAGAYSANKESIKEVFSILDYKYVMGNQRNDKLICIWKRKLSGQIIKGVFNGSGMPCEFIIECNDDERNVFQHFEIAFKARVSIYNENPSNTLFLLEEATKRVNKWFIWQRPYKNEPPLFFERRMEKMKLSYQWFIDREVERLRQMVVV